MSNTVLCPSGLEGLLRGMKVREERILADRGLARSGSQIEHLLKACWEDTTHPGPYAMPLDWGAVLQGDRFYALLYIRVLTYGADFGFAVPCRSCRARIEWEVDLTKLPVRPLSPESLATFTAGNRFETTLPDSGKRVTFKLLTGEDEQKLPALRRAAPDRLLSAVLAHRVLDIEGVDQKDKRSFIEDLTLHDADFLVDEFDRVDCGVDTTIEVECPECREAQEVDLPFDSSFFLPGKERTARRRARSASSPT